MPSTPRAIPEQRPQPAVVLPRAAAHRLVDIELPLDGASELERAASRRVFAPSLSQVAAYPKRWREGAFARAVGQVDAA